jgi:hypothetical protein
MDAGDIRDTLEIIDRVGKNKPAKAPEPELAAQIPAPRPTEVRKPEPAKAEQTQRTAPPVTVAAVRPAVVRPAAKPAAASTAESLAQESIAKIRALRRQGLESIQRGKIDAAITLLRDAYALAKGTDLSDLLLLDLERARKIKSGLVR